MSDASFRNFLDRLKETVSIEDVVSARVQGLKRAGGELKACCPFHEERTASFYVVPDKGIFHCFGCGKSGDVIGFVEAFDGLSFMEAVEELATSCGLEVPRRQRGVSREDARREQLFDALDRAARLYRKKLLGPDGEAARRYLAERGLEPAVAEAFGLGWAPYDGRTLVFAARAAGFELDALVEAGLVKRPDPERAESARSDGTRRDRSEPFDFFRGRLIVPIRDARGRTIGFGARLLPGVDGPKYLNTGETELFRKGQLVFGLDLAGEAARHSRHLVLMEGYTDVIAAHQAGLRNTVAVLGTATTEHHARLLRRTGAQRLTLVFDGDNAGRSAAIKALRGLLARGEFDRIDALALPQGQDPCDLLVERAADRPGSPRGARFMSLLEEPKDWFDHLVDGLDRSSPQALADDIDEVLDVLGVLPNPVEREARVGALAERVGLSQSSVAARFSARRVEAPANLSTRGSTGARGPLATPRQAHAAPSSPSLVQAARGFQSGSANAESGGRDKRTHAVNASPAVAPVPRRANPRELSAWADLIGACLVDNSLVALFRERFESALEGRGPEHAGLMLLLETLCEVYDEDERAHERMPSLVHPSVDASRLASAIGLRATHFDDEGFGPEGRPESGPQLGSSGEELGNGAVHEAALARRRIVHDSARELAVRQETRAPQADDVRALAQGAINTLQKIEHERTTSELLNAAGRGSDPELSRLEAANRVYGLQARSLSAGADSASAAAESHRVPTSSAQARAISTTGASAAPNH